MNHLKGRQCRNMLIIGKASGDPENFEGRHIIILCYHSTATNAIPPLTQLVCQQQEFQTNKHSLGLVPCNHQTPAPESRQGQFLLPNWMRLKHQLPQGTLLKLVFSAPPIRQKTFPLSGIRGLRLMMAWYQPPRMFLLVDTPAANTLF